jgi:hypothetical protein
MLFETIEELEALVDLFSFLLEGLRSFLVLPDFWGRELFIYIFDLGFLLFNVKENL